VKSQFLHVSLIYYLMLTLFSRWWFIVCWS